MIIETIIASATVIVVSSFAFANAVLKRTEQQALPDSFAPFQGDYRMINTIIGTGVSSRIKPWHAPEADCALCGQKTKYLTVKAENESTLVWSCCICKGSYRTNTRL
jgi:hypothetical protein